MALNREQVKAAYEAKRKQAVSLKKSSAPTREQAKRSWEQRVTAKRAEKQTEKYVPHIPDEYRQYLQSEDFSEYSEKGANIKNPTYEDAVGWFALGDWRPFGQEIGNMVTFSRDNYDSIMKRGLGNGNVVGNALYSQLSDEEVSIYNYLLGKGEKEKAAQYLSELDENLNRHTGQKIAKQVEGNKLGELTIGALGGLDRAVSSVKNLDNFVKGDKADTTPALQYASSNVRNKLDGGWGVAYDLVDTTAYMLPSVLVGTVTGGVGGAVTMGVMSAGNAYSEMRKLGYDANQSRFYSLLVGASEGGLQYLLGGIKSLGGKHLGKAATNLLSKFDNALAKIAINFGETFAGKLIGSAAEESIEESIQTILEPLFKTMATGESFEAAEWEDVLYSGLLGALSAGLLEGVPTGIGALAQNSQDTKAGREIINRDNAKGLLLDAANASKKQKLIDLASKAKGAKAGSAKEARLTGKTARGVAEEAKARKASHLTLNEVRQLGGESAAREYYDNFDKAMAAFEYQRDEARYTESSRKTTARSALEDGAILPATEKYKGEVLDAYNQGIKSYDGLASAREIAVESAKTKGISTDNKSFFEILEALPEDERAELLEMNEMGYRLAFETVRRLGVRSDGKTLGQMLDRLSRSEQKELLSLSDDTLRAAFSAGVEEKRAAVARQAEITRKIVKERRKSSDSADNSSEGKAKSKNMKNIPSNFTVEDTVDEHSLNVTQKNDLNILRRLAEFVPGIRFVITNQGVDNDGNYKALDNGYYSDGEKTVYVDISAGRKNIDSAVDFAIALAGSHEVVHAIKANAPAYFKELADFVIDTYYPGKTLDYVVKMRMEEYQKAENELAKSEDREPRKIDYDYALEEVMANSLENMLRSERVMFKLADGHRRLFSRIWQYIRDFFNRVIRKIGQYSHRTVESTIVEHANKGQRKLEDLFIKALRAASHGAAATRNESAGTNNEVRHSYAGKSAATADKMKLSTAEEMLENGADSETVRKETGWFKGYDGKWRFEIDDSDIEIAFNGKISRNPEIRRYSELLEKAYLLDSATQEDQNELAELDKKLNGKNIIPDKLGDMVKHSALFDAYPELADIGVYFHDGDSNVASYHPGFKEISLPKRLRMNARRFKTTLLHEIQHAVQDIEGFASGSNIDMFNNTAEFSAREQYENTAGEIEARDTANRAEMNAEQRKNTRPDIDRSDVVFAGDSSVSYFAKNEYNEEKAGIREQLINSQERLNQISVVFSSETPYKVGNKEQAGTWAINQLKKYGFEADRQGFGKIYFSEKSIRDAMNYLDTDAEKVSIVALYKVLKNGIQIGEHGNHKMRGKHTVTFAAPVELNGVRGNMAVVVNMRNSQYKVHRILMPDGTLFEFDETKKNATQESQRGVPKGSLANATRIASKNSIPDSDEKSNTISEISSENSGSKRFSHKEAEGREAMIEAFSMLAKTDSEKLVIDKYRRELSNIEEKIKERSELQDKLEGLKGKTGKAQERTELNAKILSLTDYITRHDGKLLELRELAPFRDVMTRYAELSYERGLDRKEHEVRMSRGGYNKMLADYTHARVYTKRDAERALEKIKGFEHVKGKLRDDLLNEYWEKLNAIESPSDERDIYIFLREKIVDAIESETRIENPEYAAAEERLAYFKGYVGHLSFSDDIKAEIRHKYDVDGSKAFFGRWGNKRAGETPVSADVFVTDFARENPGYEYLEEMSVADALFEIDSIYEKAKAVPREISTYDIASDDEIRALRSEVTDVLTEFMQKGGKKSKAAQNEELARSLHFKERLNEVMAINRAKIRLDQISQKLRDRKYGVFENITEIKGTALSALLRDLAAFNWRGTISMNNVREKVGKLLEWYSKDNPTLEHVDENNTGYYRTDVREQLELLADGEHALKAYEYEMLYNVLSYFDNFIDSYDKVWKNGKWIEAKDEAKRFINIIDDNRKYNIGTVDKLIKNRYYEMFGDPETLVHGIDYYEEGFYTTMLEYLRRTSIDAQTAELNMLAEYNAFLEENPDYLKRADSETVNYRGHEIPRLQLISLFMTLKRKHSNAGFVLSGFKYTALDGKTSVRVSPMRVDPDLPQHEIEAITMEERGTIAAKLTDEDRQYIAILEEVYNNRARELKRQRDMQRLGYSNVSDDYYYPIKRSDSAHSIDTSEMQAELDRVSSASFNKDIVKGARHKLQIESADSLFRRHVRVVCQYAYIQEAIDYYDKVFHVTVNDNKNDPRSIATESENLWAHGNEYFAALISHIQGVMPKTREGMVILNKVRSGFAKYQLGANPKVWLTQLSSIIASSNMLDFTSLVKAVSIKSDDVDKYCSLARLRNEDNAAYMAQGVFDRTTVAGKAEGVISRAGDVLMVPIGKMDRAVIRHLFAACQSQVEKDGGAAAGTEENKAAAGELLESVIIKTQQNALSTEKSAAMRSTNEILRALTMFSADSMKIFGRLLDSFGEWRVMRTKAAHSTGEARTQYLARAKAAGRKIRRAVAAIAGTSIFMVLIGIFFKHIRAKDDEITPEAAIIDGFGNLLGGLPLIRDSYSVIFNGYDLENFTYSAFNDVFQSVRSLGTNVEKLITGERELGDVMRGVKSFLYSVGQITGIPVRNVYNYIHDLIKRFFPEAAESIDEFFGY